MKRFLVIWMVLLLLCRFSYGEAPPFTNDKVTEAIQNSLPFGWKIVETSTDEIPHGHYWGLKYNSRKGEKLVLQGPRDVFFRWRDHQNQYHDAAIAKEALEVWIMPPEYGLSWKRHFVIDKPIPAELIASGKVAKVYGYQTHRIVIEDQFQTLLKQASETSWPSSPVHKHISLSWENWRKDLRGVLENVLNKREN